MSWSEEEARAAVRAYFRLLSAEQAGKPTNKAALYRKLSAKFPKRNPNAFESKFQNISAILYELRLPYCSGLKPRSNYQRLLRLLVLDHLDRSPLPAVEPHEILFAKLNELSRLGAIPVGSKGAGRFGHAIERALGIEPNSSKDADFMGIELKTKHDKTLQTLFSRVPSRYLSGGNRRAFFDRHSRFDKKRSRRALHGSFNKKPDKRGFSVLVDGQTVVLARSGSSVLEYDAELLEEALLSKHTQTAYLTLASRRRGGTEECLLESATYCKWPSIIRFLQLVTAGDVFLDLTISENDKGKLRDHGFLWRIRSESLDRLYLSTERVKLGAE
jgi:hypothetical protein